MPTEVIVALIALAGVAISVIVSVLTTERVTKADLQKLRTEIQQTYAGKLLERRLAVYPDIYYPLSDFIKRYRYDKVTKEYLEEFRNKTNELNSKYSIFYSGDTNLVSTEFRKVLDKLLLLTEQEPKEEYSEALRSLRHIAGHLELSLKSDIGIFVVEFSDPNRRFSSYTEMIEHVRKDNKS